MHFLAESCFGRTCLALNVQVSKIHRVERIEVPDYGQDVTVPNKPWRGSVDIRCVFENLMTHANSALERTFVCLHRLKTVCWRLLALSSGVHVLGPNRTHIILCHNEVLPANILMKSELLCLCVKVSSYACTSNENISASHSMNCLVTPNLTQALVQ